MSKPTHIKLAFYGDDFTGSTDALEFLTRAGARTVLFLRNPDSEMMARFGDIDAIGVAGMTRSMAPDEMAQVLSEAFESLKKLDTDHVHYKVCSTFDSSPEIGNIGTAIDIGQKVFDNPFTPILVAAPNLGRYSAFGNLFARMGIGSEGAIYRLDEHPSMSKHPTTPALDGDLRDHLAKQVNMKMGLIDLTDLVKSDEAILEKIENLKSEGTEVVFFDAMYEDQMQLIGSVLHQLAPKPLFSVGSSGIEKALGDFWGAKKELSPRSDWQAVKEEPTILVLSGSASPVTADQIEEAESLGWESVGLEVDALKDPERYQVGYVGRIINALIEQKSVIFHTCKGPNDKRIAETEDYFTSLGLSSLEMRKETARQFGGFLGKIAREVLSKVEVNRLVIAGGDTSSYAARALGIDAVEMIARIVTGAPLCRAYAEGSPADGLQINLKGGQVGDRNYFEALRKGRLN
ncbi:MAG: four-carbon acid sugar kinase family protein [Marinoscillum sp.]